MGFEISMTPNKGKGQWLIDNAAAIKVTRDDAINLSTDDQQVSYRPVSHCFVAVIDRGVYDRALIIADEHDLGVTLAGDEPTEWYVLSLDQISVLNPRAHRYMEARRRGEKAGKEPAPHYTDPGDEHA